QAPFSQVARVQIAVPEYGDGLDIPSATIKSDSNLTTFSADSTSSDTQSPQTQQRPKTEKDLHNAEIKNKIAHMLGIGLPTQEELKASYMSPVQNINSENSAVVQAGVNVDSLITANASSQQMVSQITNEQIVNNTISQGMKEQVIKPLTLDDLINNNINSQVVPTPEPVQPQNIISLNEPINPQPVTVQPQPEPVAPNTQTFGPSVADIIQNINQTPQQDLQVSQEVQPVVEAQTTQMDVETVDSTADNNEIGLVSQVEMSQLPKPLTPEEFAQSLLNNTISLANSKNASDKLEQSQSQSQLLVDQVQANHPVSTFNVVFNTQEIQFQESQVASFETTTSLPVLPENQQNGFDMSTSMTAPINPNVDPLDFLHSLNHRINEFTEVK
ncbi:MAG: hypothetical protein LBM27_04625, partial [Lactobacillaceae bacterium]|nr:hypothetical protein [Lactobacillaceae bacterium]